MCCCCFEDDFGCFLRCFLLAIEQYIKEYPVFFVSYSLIYVFYVFVCNLNFSGNKTTQLYGMFQETPRFVTYLITN